MSLHETPKITVIIPNYNHANLIENAIDSIVNQAYLNKKICIIDNGSNDNSAQKIFDLLNNKKECENKNIPYISGLYKNSNLEIFLIACKNHKNASFARNLGITLCFDNTDIFSFLDADDEYLDSKILESCKILLNGWGSIGCVYSDHIENNNGIKSYKIKIPFNAKINYLNNEITSNSLIPKYVFEKIGMFNENFEVYENNEFSSRLSKYFIGYHIPKKLYKVNISDNSLTNYISKYKLFKNKMFLQEIIIDEQ